VNLQMDGKTALVLSASRGIGHGVATTLARSGCRVVVASSSADRIEAAAAAIRKETGGDITAEVIDLADPVAARQATDEVVLRHGPFSILVVNGPGPKVVDAASATVADIRAALDIGVSAPVAVCQAVLPGMVEAGYGRIIVLASTTAKEPDEGMVLSNLTRAALAAYAKTLSREVGKQGVTVNTVLTGSVLSERSESQLRAEAESVGQPYEDFLREVEDSIPVGRIASTDEFAQAIAFLASPLSSYVTGAAIPVDGGWMRGV
jgi:3-oxoacyl-[acyl-carrier protein] reductase